MGDKPSYDDLNHRVHVLEAEKIILEQKVEEKESHLRFHDRLFENLGLDSDAITEGPLPILCLDFDGVLARYERGWPGNAAMVAEEPVEGAQDFVRRAQEAGWRVMVYSARSGQAGGIRAMRTWLKRHGFPEVELPGRKPPITLTIDDQAIRFEGAWPDPKEILKLKPWYKR